MDPFFGSLLNTVGTAYGQIAAGKTARIRAETQAAMDAYQAEVEQEEALKTAQIIRNAGRKQVGQAVGAYAAAGVKVGEGSALETERQINVDVEHDAFQAILSGNRRARGLQLEAEFSRIDGKQAQLAGYVNAAGTVLGGAYQAMRSNGWRTGGPGFSGTQAAAPVETRNIKPW